MASLSISIEACTGNVSRVMERIAAEWPADKQEAFAVEWQGLADAGAPMIETQIIGSRIIAYPSEDFTRHLEKWGVASW